jgi:uncharacterized protein YjiS (DUF1127 family)
MTNLGAQQIKTKGDIDMLIISAIQRSWSKTKSWYEVAQQRRELRGLSDEILKDIGISRSDADFEANRHFWDVSLNSDSTLRKTRTTEVSSFDKSHYPVCCS